MQIEKHKINNEKLIPVEYLNPPQWPRYLLSKFRFFFVLFFVLWCELLSQPAKIGQANVEFVSSHKLGTNIDAEVKQVIIRKKGTRKRAFDNRPKCQFVSPSTGYARGTINYIKCIAQDCVIFRYFIYPTGEQFLPKLRHQNGIHVVHHFSPFYVSYQDTHRIP